MTETVHAVTFDAAGTLIETAEPVSNVYARVARAHGINMPATAIASAFRSAFAQTPAPAFSSSSLEQRDTLERMWWRRLVEKVFAQHTENENFATMFNELYGHYALGTAWRLCPDAKEVLSQLHNRKIKIAVLSNFDSRLVNILKALDVADCLNAIIYSTLVGAAKPDAKIFSAALSALGVEAKDTLHVGDNATADYDGARACGMRALLISENGNMTDAIPRLRHVLERL